MDNCDFTVAKQTPLFDKCIVDFFLITQYMKYLRYLMKHQLFMVFLQIVIRNKYIDLSLQ